MPSSTAIAHPTRFLDHLVHFLTPFFTATCPDLDAARTEILETLASYGARTRSELLNAAQIIAYGLSALEILHEAQTTDMSVSMRLRLRGCANNLNRSAQQNQQVLAKRLACDTPDAVQPPPEPIDDITDAQVQEQFLKAHAKLAAYGVNVPMPSPLAKPSRIAAKIAAVYDDRPWSSAMMQALSDEAARAARPSPSLPQR